MRVEKLPIDGLLLIHPVVRLDPRGFFLETYHQQRYRDAGVTCDFVQDNHSYSVKHTLRGMHFQTAPGQAKLVQVVQGEIYDVVVDMRPGSATFGRWQSTTLNAAEHAQLFIPVGFAHGFCVQSDSADVLYKVSSAYDARTESSFAWNDEDIGIKWPIATPLLSERDSRAPRFKEVSNTKV